MNNLEKSELITPADFEEKVLEDLRKNNCLPALEDFYGTKIYKSSAKIVNNEKEISFQESPLVRAIIWNALKEHYGRGIIEACEKNNLTIEEFENFIFNSEGLENEDLKQNAESLFSDLKDLISFSNTKTDIIANVWSNFISPLIFLGYEEAIIQLESQEKEEDREVKKALNNFIQKLQGLGSSFEAQNILDSYRDLKKELSKNPIFAELFEHDMKSAEQGITAFDLFNFLDVEQWDKSMAKYPDSITEQENRFKIMITSFNHVIMIVKSFFEAPERNKNSSVKKLNSYLNGLKTFFEGRKKKVEINLIVEDTNKKRAKVERNFDKIKFLNIRQKISLPHLYRLIYGFLSNAFAEGKGNADSVDIQIIAQEEGKLFLEITQDGENVKVIPQKLLERDKKTRIQKIWGKGRTISSDNSGQGLGMNPQLLKNLGAGNINFFNSPNNQGIERGGMRIELTSENVSRILEQINVVKYNVGTVLAA